MLSRRLVFASDEYYLLADRPFPPPATYEGFEMHEDGIGMARTLELELLGEKADATGRQEGFFVWADASTSTDAEPTPTPSPSPEPTCDPAERPNDQNCGCLIGPSGTICAGQVQNGMRSMPRR